MEHEIDVLDVLRLLAEIDRLEDDVKWLQENKASPAAAKRSAKPPAKPAKPKSKTRRRGR